MGKVIIHEETTKNPITLIGKNAGICYGANTSDPERNYNRGINCLESEHGRTLEFPEVYMTLDGYSARVIREFYTHIGGLPTRLQASTRYINYQDSFDTVIPPSIENNIDAKEIFIEAIQDLILTLRSLENLGIPKEDSAMLLPLGMTTTVVCKMNLRTLRDMSHQRMCNRAYWEFRKLFQDIGNALAGYSEEWATVVKNEFVPKCAYLGKCPEKQPCGQPVIDFR